MSYAIKLIVTALVVVLSAETAKKFPLLGAAIIALPLASMIAMTFLYYDTQDANKVAQFAREIPPLLIPTILFFYAFSYMVESGIGFVTAMVASTMLMLGGYGLYMYFFAKNGL
jgi:hypothetical protein